jgi:hypothetical protein
LTTLVLATDHQDTTDFELIAGVRSRRFRVTGDAVNEVMRREETYEETYKDEELA